MTEDATHAGIWTSPWLRPFNDVAAIDDLLAQMHPTWALGRIKARVAAICAETPDTKSFVLRPNRNWRGVRAGQHLGVEVDIAGVRHQRRYSVSSAAGTNDRVAITVKRQSGGTVSNWLHDHLRVGDVVVLQPPAGDFVLPEPVPARLLLLAAGSGVTPHMAMIRTLAARHPRLDVVLLHVVRRPAEAIFAAELAGLAASWPALTVRHHYSAAGRFDVAALAGTVPDHLERHTLLCGPTSFMETFRDHWRTNGAAARLQLESFGAPLTTAGFDGPRHLEIRCGRSERLFTAAGTAPLLVEAEHAGLRPRAGCRMGICHTCSCIKRSGVVENLLTGEISSEPDERIQLCISRARTDLTLDL